jgi:hypothetical protein
MQKNVIAGTNICAHGRGLVLNAVLKGGTYTSTIAKQVSNTSPIH